MHISKIISFLKIGLFLSLLHLITMPDISAGWGDKGTITKELLIDHFKNKESVDDYVIEGSDIIDIIKEPDYQDYHIDIRYSIIKGGLDFSSIPKTHIDDIIRSNGSDGKYSKEFKEKIPPQEI